MNRVLTSQPIIICKGKEVPSHMTTPEAGSGKSRKGESRVSPCKPNNKQIQTATGTVPKVNGDILTWEM